MLHRFTFLRAIVLILGCCVAVANAAAADAIVADSFETGDAAPENWKQGTAVPGVKYVYDKKLASEGKRSLSLQKTAKRYFPIAGWSRIFDHTDDKPALKVAIKVRAAKVTKAIVDVQFADAAGKMLSHEWAIYIGQKEEKDPVATHEWKAYEGAVKIPPGTKQLAIDLQIYGPGSVWFDELEATYVDAVKEKPAEGGTASASPEGEPQQDSQPIDVTMQTGDVARYLLVPPNEGTTAPAAGFPLLLVLPGGDGSAEFHPFVRSIHESVLGGKFVVAQPLAPAHVVWPTRTSTARVSTTEDAVTAIIEDVAGKHRIDRKRIYALGWSSSGPAVYAMLLAEKSPLAGAIVAMSVFKPDQLPSLSRAKGRRLYLLHSSADTVCPYRMAKDAKQQLAAAGADVTLVDYAGGHGWHGPVHDMLHTGMAWLER